jgi:hypothetical protein
MMKQENTWVLQKIQAQGIADNAVYTIGAQIAFTTTTPLVPVFNLNESTDIALSLIRYEEAWWIINHSDEYCCAVNDQIVEPYHRMRLNEGDVIEWGLSTWRLVRNDTFSQRVHSEDRQPQSAISPQAMAEYLDLEWFKHQKMNPQNPFDIIPAYGAASPEDSPETNNALNQLYREYQQALLSPAKESRNREDPFPLNNITTQYLASLRERTAEIGSLQDMVTGELSIDAIIDVLGANGDDETPWPAVESVPDILHLLSLGQTRQAAHNDILPDLTQREHRIIGIDSHYRMNITQKNGDPSHEKK